MHRRIEFWDGPVEFGMVDGPPGHYNALPAEAQRRADPAYEQARSDPDPDHDPNSGLLPANRFHDELREDRWNERERIREQVMVRVLSISSGAPLRVSGTELTDEWHLPQKETSPEHRQSARRWLWECGDWERIQPILVGWVSAQRLVHDIEAYGVPIGVEGVKYLNWFVDEAHWNERKAWEQRHP